MKTMKKILSAFTALSLVTVAGVSTVACDSPNQMQEIFMSNELLSLLGVYERGSSAISAKIDHSEEDASVPIWSLASQSKFKASMLLTEEGSAKSDEAFLLLKNTLGLSSKFGLFDRTEAEKFIFNIGDNIRINLVMNGDYSDFVWDNGSVDGYWMTSDKKICAVRDLNIKGLEDHEDGVLNVLPFAWSYRGENINYFNTSASDGSFLADFKIGAPINKNKFENKDITNLLKKDSEAGKWLFNLVAFLKKGESELKIKTATIERGEGNTGENFEKGDELWFTVSIGGVSFKIEKTEFYFVLTDK